MAKKETQIETVTRTLTVTLPKQFDDYLESLAKAAGRTVESLMLEDLYSILENLSSSLFSFPLFLF